MAVVPRREATISISNNSFSSPLLLPLLERPERNSQASAPHVLLVVELLEGIIRTVVTEITEITAMRMVCVAAGSQPACWSRKRQAQTWAGNSTRVGNPGTSIAHLLRRYMLHVFVLLHGSVLTNLQSSTRFLHRDAADRCDYFQWVAS